MLAKILSYLVTANHQQNASEGKLEGKHRYTLVPNSLGSICLTARRTEANAGRSIHNAPYLLPFCYMIYVNNDFTAVCNMYIITEHHSLNLFSFNFCI